MKNEKVSHIMKLQRKKDKISFFSCRFYFLFGCMLLALLGLLFRIAYLQIINPKKLVYEGNMRSLRIQKIPAVRGMITDRFGRPLAVSVPVNAVWADPKEINDHGGITKDNKWKEFSKVLSISLDQLSSRINSHSKRCYFVYLARQINPSISDYICKLNLPGIYLQQESRRYYPTGQITAHLIGITNIDNKGIDGIEKSFNYYLSGQSGERMVRKDRHGQVIEYITLINRKKAQNLILSIDERLQSLVFHELNNAVIFNQAESGTAILVDINTGEILAMANSPSYNPNQIRSTLKTIRNYAITDVFEPGSTVKPMVIMTALHRGIVQKNSVLNTLPYMINGYQIKDVGYYNKLTLTGILKKSSNVGVSKLALLMPSSALIDTYSRFGLGQPTNLGLVGEVSGLYPHKKKWSSIERATFSYGYGLMVTPLQLARVYATIGSFGIIRPLSITRVNLPVKGEQIFPKSLVRTVIHMMENVSLPRTSGNKSAVKRYRASIKTGTVKKVGLHGKYINQYIAYTAGIAPTSKPRFAVVVVINGPKGKKYYGGEISAPVFETIMQKALRTMNIKPDEFLKSDNHLINQQSVKRDIN